MFCYSKELNNSFLLGKIGRRRLITASWRVVVVGESKYSTRYHSNPCNSLVDGEKKCTVAWKIHAPCTSSVTASWIYYVLKSCQVADTSPVRSPMDSTKIIQTFYTTAITYVIYKYTVIFFIIQFIFCLLTQRALTTATGERNKMAYIHRQSIAENIVRISFLLKGWPNPAPCVSNSP